MIQDIAPKKLDNQYKPAAEPKDDSVIFYFEGRDVLVRKDEGKLFPTFAQLGRPEGCVYLFTIGKKEFFLLLGDAKPVLPEGFDFEPIRSIRENKEAKLPSFYAFYTALHLRGWYLTNRFCGVCGHKTVLDAKERALRCPKCNHVIYPRINPAIIVGVLHDGRILLTRYAASHNDATVYALIAGFTEIGETFEETVAREVKEEVGLKVKNIRYYKSQPWGSAADILAGFYCDLDGDDTIKMDKDELSRAFWAKPEEVILQPDDWSLTNEMMARFKDGKPC
ncbi:NAD(+) diphosphatase [uncultured Mitsuokella sp.]|uniref:NAD(+) diphosphatase n=1 Tax=uncultured Mitsuokella sp. TaxID=453120 RepID=UPI0025D2C44A|nr:NAD(+) diphosphatase [uncultured Mitsuokella sp.]